VNLQPRDRIIALKLAHTPGVVSSDMLQLAWGPGRVNLTAFRRRLRAHRAPGQLDRIRGLGYRMSADLRLWVMDNVTGDHMTDQAAAAPRIFVFGSNTHGRHGKGAALEARQKHGAVYGQGEGRQGDSYAIPTKPGDNLKKSLPIETIRGHVERFLDYAREHPDLTFNLTRIGCGLAGYKDRRIAPLFTGAPDNVIMPTGFRKALNELAKEADGLADATDQTITGTVDFNDIIILAGQANAYRNAAEAMRTTGG
jgi:hypothetical protein